MTPGRNKTTTHYKPKGTADLFAAMNFATPDPAVKGQFDVLAGGHE